jgi:hypothetical protein
MPPRATAPGYRRFRRPRSPAARNETGHLPFANRAGCKWPRRRAAPSTICQWTRMPLRVVQTGTGRAGWMGRACDVTTSCRLPASCIHGDSKLFFKKALNCDGFQNHSKYYSMTVTVLWYCPGLACSLASQVSGMSLACYARCWLSTRWYQGHLHRGRSEIVYACELLCFKGVAVSLVLAQVLRSEFFANLWRRRTVTVMRLLRG